ncbi:putative invertase inhibitor [Chenopodium quinoa]|uniref:putative invertase inhibitor n=1 Tax=Chenopodium quinoa TaxID=63459 RepID=UPI000B7726F4|nr:putative invertase inhibitor [Chenopodium quinoa]
MRSSSIFLYSFVFIFSLLVPLQCVTPTENISADIINKTCETCAQKTSSNYSYDFCYSSLAAVPVSHSTDLAGLGLIALELALENATNTFWIISGMLTKNESDLRCSSCLESCMELYLEMNIKLEESIGEYVSGKKHDAIYLWVSEIMQATNKCEAGFKEESNESPLTRENNTLSQLCGIILCIIDLISSDLNSWS